MKQVSKSFNKQYITKYGKKATYSTAKFKCELCNGIVRRQVTAGKSQKSCGCNGLGPKRGNKGGRYGTHGQAHKSSEYYTWMSMMGRAVYRTCNQSSYYKDISVCERWKNFENFFKDMGPKPKKGWHIHRIDATKDYELNNCIWISPSEHSKLHDNLKSYRNKREDG
jgi:hypothetical protein